MRKIKSFQYLSSDLLNTTRHRLFLEDTCLRFLNKVNSFLKKVVRVEQRLDLPRHVSRQESEGP